MLPKWLRVGGEYRLRFEDFDGSRFQSGNDDHYLLQRFRLYLSWEPAPLFRVFVQSQDSRILGNDRVPSAPPVRDSFDIRQAYVELGGDRKSPLTLRAGRQDFNFGEERIVGSGNWSNTARSFDAVSLKARFARGIQATIFAASVVPLRNDLFDRPHTGDDLHGIYGEIKDRIPHANLEPYLFWRIGPAHLDSKTYGVRVFGGITKRLTYNVETAGQNGFRSGSPVSGSGFYGRIALGAKRRWAPTIRGEYTFASSSFEPVYPVAHDKYGLADQIGWHNIHHLGATGEWKPFKNWTWQLKQHQWWLADPSGSLLTPTFQVIARDPAGRSGRYVGREVDVQAQWAVRKGVLLGAGFAHITPGGYLRRRAQGAAQNFSYLMSVFTF